MHHGWTTSQAKQMLSRQKLFTLHVGCNIHVQIGQPFILAQTTKVFEGSANSSEQKRFAFELLFLVDGCYVQWSGEGCDERRSHSECHQWGSGDRRCVYLAEVGGLPTDLVRIPAQQSTEHFHRSAAVLFHHFGKQHGAHHESGYSSGVQHRLQPVHSHPLEGGVARAQEPRDGGCQHRAHVQTHCAHFRPHNIHMLPVQLLLPEPDSNQLWSQCEHHYHFLCSF